MELEIIFIVWTSLPITCLEMWLKSTGLEHNPVTVDIQDSF